MTGQESTGGGFGGMKMGGGSLEKMVEHVKDTKAKREATAEAKIEHRTAAAGGGLMAKWLAENPPPAEPQPDGKTAKTGNPVEVLLGDESREILKIANSDKTVDDKMREICGIDNSKLYWKSPQWATLLGCSGGAIRQAEFWTEDRKKAVEAYRELYSD